jgi:hypothetical protein
MLLFQAIARAVTFLLLALLALAGLALAIFSIGPGESDVSLPGLADLIALDELRDRVGELFASVEDGDEVEVVPALAGLGAIAVGCLLIVGALGSRRERLVTLPREDEDGVLGARRRPLGQMVVALADQPREITPRSVKVRPSRRGPGGRVDIAVDHPKTSEGVGERTIGALEPITKPFELRTRVRTRATSRVR